MQRRYANDPVFREQVKAAAKAWREANPEAVKEQHRRANANLTPEQRERRRLRSRAWREAHPDASRRYIAERMDADPEFAAARRSLHTSVQGTRRARKLEVLVERVDRAVVFERDGGVCGICHEAADPARWHLDHVVPLALGGAHAYDNVQVTHPACNLRKGGR
jgi:5-methylcytosine-specific restriction endonuclease McrA